MNEDLRSVVERMVREAVEGRVHAIGGRSVPINISARHMHVSQEHLGVLFGPGTVLTKLRDLMQPGEFAANETVAVVGKNRRVFEQVRILGPVRKSTQVELSYTDGRYLGMDLPARVSGDIAGTHPVILVGPRGVVQLSEGVIRALRHVHIGEDDAARIGLRNGQLVSVRAFGPLGVTFDQVLIRAGKNLVREMHVDTDEANAAGLGPGAVGEIVFS
jgi:putative phosphotransacetylase